MNLNIFIVLPGKKDELLKKKELLSKILEGDKSILRKWEIRISSNDDFSVLIVSPQYLMISLEDFVRYKSEIFSFSWMIFHKWIFGEQDIHLSREKFDSSQTVQFMFYDPTARNKNEFARKYYGVVFDSPASEGLGVFDWFASNFVKKSTGVETVEVIHEMTPLVFSYSLEDRIKLYQEKPDLDKKVFGSSLLDTLKNYRNAVPEKNKKQFEEMMKKL